MFIKPKISTKKTTHHNKSLKKDTESDLIIIKDVQIQN